MHKKKNKTSSGFREKILENIKKNRFILILTCLYALISIFIIVAFYPGFMSFDTINQFSQLNGLIPLNDWHPPIMALLWKLLINITGLTGSLLILTVGIFTISSFLLSLYLYRITDNKVVATMPLTLLVMPYTLNFLGVLWKDVLLAAFFMLAFVLILLGASDHKSWQLKKSYRNVLIILGAATLIFGSTFRHGVWPAFIPLLIYGAYQLQLSKRLKIFIAAIYVLLIVTTPLVIIKAFSVLDGKASIVIMIDDLIKLNTESEIKNSALSDDSKNYLLGVQRQCDVGGVRSYAAFLCDETHTAFSNTVQKEFDVTQDFWIDSIKKKPFDYINHRVRVFLQFLDPSYVFAWQDRTDPNRFNIQALNSPATFIVEDYVKFFIRNWPSLFKPYFWLIVLLGLFIATVKRRKELHHSMFIIVVSISSILFLLSFLPAAIVSDYRMTYTFTFAVNLVLILYLVDTFNTRVDKKRH